MTRPWLLDLFCCQGAASHGYHLAGFDVEGVDNVPQPRYPYPYVMADAVGWLAAALTRQFRPDALHASPPCQAHSNAQRIRRRRHADFIEPIRELFESSGLPYVIENVVGAPLKNPVLLCGAMFPGLNTYRHRLFESNITLNVPEHAEHVQQTVKMGRPIRHGDWYHAVGNFSGVPYVRDNMGVGWMSRDGIRECIPPVYTEHIGRQLLAAVGVKS